MAHLSPLPLPGATAVFLTLPKETDSVLSFYRVKVSHGDGHGHGAGDQAGADRGEHRRAGRLARRHRPQVFFVVPLF